jgi:hypothetical protein
MRRCSCWLFQECAGFGSVSCETFMVCLRGSDVGVVSTLRGSARTVLSKLFLSSLNAGGAGTGLSVMLGSG